MDPSTRFDDDEVRRILARAAERQERAERTALPAGELDGPAGTGLSLADLREAAREAGIAPALVDDAARELRLGTDSTEGRYRFLGIPRRIAMQRFVPATVDEREWERIVGEARRAFRVSGVTERFGDVREWSSNAAETDAAAHLRLAPTEGGTHVSLHRSTRHLSITTHAMGWTFGFMAALFSAIVAFGQMTDPATVAIPLGTWALTGAGLLAARLGARHSARRTARTFERLLDRIDLIARDPDSP